METGCLDYTCHFHLDLNSECKSKRGMILNLPPGMLENGGVHFLNSHTVHLISFSATGLPVTPPVFHPAWAAGAKSANQVFIYLFS